MNPDRLKLLAAKFGAGDPDDMLPISKRTVLELIEAASGPHVRREVPDAVDCRRMLDDAAEAVRAVRALLVATPEPTPPHVPEGRDPTKTLASALGDALEHEEHLDPGYWGAVLWGHRREILAALAATPERQEPGPVDATQIIEAAARIADDVELGYSTVMRNGDADTARCIAAAIRALASHPPRESGDAPGAWRPIETAAETPGVWVWVFAPGVQGLSDIICPCQWHPDAGWCVDELRHVTMWQPMIAPPSPRAATGDES